MCMCGWFTLLYGRNSHNLVKQLYSNQIKTKQKYCSPRHHITRWKRRGCWVNSVKTLFLTQILLICFIKLSKNTDQEFLATPLAPGWLMGLPPSGFWPREHFALCWRAGHSGQVQHLHRNAWSLAILSLSFPICQSRDSKRDSGSIFHSLFSTHFFSSFFFFLSLSVFLICQKKKILSLLPYLAQFTKQKAPIHSFAMKHLEAQCLTLWRFHEKCEVSLGLQVLMVSLGRKGWDMKQLEDINESGNSDRFYFLGLQNHFRQWLKP